MVMAAPTREDRALMRVRGAGFVYVDQMWFVLKLMMPDRASRQQLTLVSISVLGTTSRDDNR
jgi:hypothetical protein